MVKLAIPQTGKLTGKVVVRRWRKAVGQAVRPGELIAELDAPTGLVQIEAGQAGVLTRILANPGQTVAEGAPLAEITPGTPGASGSAAGSIPGSSASEIPAPKSELPPTLRLPTEAPPQKTTPTGAIPTSNPQPSSSPMTTPNVIPVLMPKAGQSMEEGTIVKWLVQPGAKINKGDMIFEIETDKATMEVEATDSGRLARIVVDAGGCVPVLTPVAYLADNDAEVDAFLAAASGSSPASAPSEQRQDERGLTPATTSDIPQASSLSPQTSAMLAAGRAKASPAARKLASQRGIDLNTLAATGAISGSGPDGRILSTDVPASAPAPGKSPAGVPGTTTAAAARLPTGIPQDAALTRPTKTDIVFPPITVPGVERKRMSQMRKAIARNLSYSKSTIPHWYISATINAQPMLDFYKGQKVKYPVSVNDVIVAACAKALMEFPMFRTRVDGEELVLFPGANIGVAVGMDEGLVVPVVLNAQNLTLQDLAAETKRLANAAKAGKIENMGQGVFTISNLGMFGVEEFVAIVNPPEAAILAVAAARDDLQVVDGAIRLTKTMKLTLSMDHRVIDGVWGARFLARLREILENPQQLVL